MNRSTHPIAPPADGTDEALLSIRSGRAGSTYVIALYGELDLSNVDQVKRTLAEAEATDVSDILVDLSALHFIDSTGISLLHEAHRVSSANGGRLRMLRAPAPVHRAIEICGLDGVLPFVG